MAELARYLIPAFVLLYFVVSTVIAVLKRLATPPLPWPVEPEEMPGEAPSRAPQPATVRARPEQAERAPAERSEPPAGARLDAEPPALEPPGSLADRSLDEGWEPLEGVELRSTAPRRTAAPGDGGARRRNVRRMLQGSSLRDAVLLAEVIGPPRALRPYTPPSLPK